MTRGQLRIYLGAAPGVGKTYAMLSEGRRRHERGTDVVVAVVETHGRAHTAAQVGDLEIVPRKSLEHRGAGFQEMDVEAVLARHPRVALVDELAHTNAPGSVNEKRYQDVEQLLDAGIDVISTVNVQHLESLNDVVETITGIRQRETVPDRVVRDADQVELVDMTPEALRRRMAHGNIYGPEKVDAALANYFRPGNLSALRELALLWVASAVDDATQAYKDDHHIDQPWETRERVVVAVSGGPNAERLIRRAARIAHRSHGELIGVHVRAQDGLRAGADTADLAGLHRLVESFGGRVLEVVTDDVARGLVDVARSVDATQLVLGATRRTRGSELLHGSVVNQAIRRAGPIDVHVISPDEVVQGAPLPVPARAGPGALPRRRQMAGWIVATAVLPALTVALVWGRDRLSLSTTLLLYLMAVCGIAALGGLGPGLAAAVVAALLADTFFTEPYNTLRIHSVDQVVAIVAFVAVATLVSLLVGQAARQAAAARRARAEAEALASTAGRLGGDRSLPSLLAHIRTVFGQRAVTLKRRTASGWTVEHVDGDLERSDTPGGITVPVSDLLELTLDPGGLGPDDQRVLEAFVGQLADTAERTSVQEAAQRLELREEADQLRTAILRAVSHDLRSPLSTIKAASTSLLQTDVEWTDDQRHDFAEMIDIEADRLNRLIGDLLDMSRLDAGVVRPAAIAVRLADIVDAVTDGRPNVATSVNGDPVVIGDPALLERALANLVTNAIAHGSSGAPVLVEATVVDRRAVIRVVDRGPGIDPEDRAQVVAPFHRLGDATPDGVGLGLAVVNGFVSAMGGRLSLDDTPGGGLTATMSFPAAGDDATRRGDV